MVTMFFTVSVVNNYALNLNIAMPLHMIFRSVSAAGLHTYVLKNVADWVDETDGQNRKVL